MLLSISSKSNPFLTVNSWKLYIVFSNSSPEPINQLIYFYLFINDLFSVSAISPYYTA
jgi:hypothetical protein